MNERDSLESGFTLDQWHIRPLVGTFSRGGHDTHVEPKVMDVLLALARRPGEVISRQDILDDVWPDVVVTDDVLTRCISELRTLLGDTGKTRTYIRTIPKRGYSLIATVGAAQPSSANNASLSAVAQDAPPAAGVTQANSVQPNKISVIATGIAALTLIAVAGLWVGKNYMAIDDNGADAQTSNESSASNEQQANNISSIAVLPFANLSGDIEHEYFSDGLSEDIRNTLINTGDLRVAARTSSNAFRNRAMDVRDIAKQLNVDALLEGTVRMIDKELRVTAQLTSGRDGYPIWSQSYQRDIQDKLDLQSTISQEIVNRLTPALSGQIDLVKVATNSVKAHEYYLLGRHQWHQRNAESVEKAITHFDQARELDPNYALAYSGLADSYVFSALYGNLGMSEAIELATPHAQKALQLDPSLAEAHASIGMIYETQGNDKLALASYQRTAQLKPQYAMGQMWLGNTYSSLGAADKALEHHQTASVLDPLHPQVQSNYIRSLMNTGNYDQAESTVNGLLLLESNPSLLQSKLMVYLNTGRYDEVLLAALSNTSSKLVSSYTNHSVVLAFIYLGRYDEAKQILKDMHADESQKMDLQLGSMLAIAQRDTDNLREIAARFESDPTMKKKHRVKGCQSLSTEQLLLQADFIDQQHQQVIDRSRRILASLEAGGHCPWDIATLPEVASYLIASSQALELPVSSYQADTSKAWSALETLSSKGWADPEMRIFEVTLALLTEQFQRADELLNQMQRSSLLPYGILKFKPLFEQLTQNAEATRILARSKADYDRMQTRSESIELAKLGL